MSYIEEMAATDIGEQVRVHRRAKGWTQEKLAQVSELRGGSGTVSEIENGMVMPSVGTLSMLSHYLGENFIIGPNIRRVSKRSKYKQDHRVETILSAKS